MDLLLKFAIDFVQHVEAKKMIADYNLIAVVEDCFTDQFAINQCAIGRIKIGNPIARFVSLRIAFAGNSRMEPRGAGIVEPDISFQSATNHDLISLNRNWYRHQFSPKGNQRGPALFLS